MVIFYVDHNNKIITKGLNHLSNGIDDIIFIDEISEKDSLSPKELDEGYIDVLYTLDKSNNFSTDTNSIYIRLMKFLNPEYLKEEDIPSETSHSYLDNPSPLDLYTYFEYTPKRCGSTYNLHHAYIVPAEPLRHQIIGILNDILRNGNSNNTVELCGSNLNNEIIEAYSMVEHDQYTPITEIELFKACNHGFDVKDIVLKIPEMD